MEAHPLEQEFGQVGGQGLVLLGQGGAREFLEHAALLLLRPGAGAGLDTQVDDRLLVLEQLEEPFAPVRLLGEQHQHVLPRQARGQGRGQGVGRINRCACRRAASRRAGLQVGPGPAQVAVRPGKTEAVLPLGGGERRQVAVRPVRLQAAGLEQGAQQASGLVRPTLRVGLAGPLPQPPGHLARVEQAGVGNPEDLAPGQQAETAQSGDGGVDVLLVAVDGVDGAAFCEQGRLELFGRAPAEVAVADQQVDLGVQLLRLAEETRQGLAREQRHEPLTPAGVPAGCRTRCPRPAWIRRGSCAGWR